MSRSEVSPADHELAELAARFHQWRQTRPTPRDRIPPALWDQAAALSTVLPISRVAKTLRVSPGELKTRRATHLGASPLQSAPAALGFVEVPGLPPGLSLPSGMEVELARPDGCRLRIHYREPHPSLAAVVRVFLGEA